MYTCHVKNIFCRIGIGAVRGIPSMNIIFAISCDYCRVVRIGSGGGGRQGDWFLQVMISHNETDWDRRIVGKTHLYFYS
jgi:hypothetical protein